MSDLILGLGQMLAVIVIVGGVSVALWQVWVLANKLCRNCDQDAYPAPAEPHVHIAERRPSKVALDSGGRMRQRTDAR